MHSIDVKMKKLFLCMAVISLSVTFSVGYLNAAESYFPCPVYVNAGLKGKIRHVKKRMGAPRSPLFPEHSEFSTRLTS
jgi:hypothetical protein